MLKLRRKDVESHCQTNTEIQQRHFSTVKLQQLSEDICLKEICGFAIVSKI